MKKINEYCSGDSVLEIGAGGSDWLIRIAKELNPSYCAGLDYSALGCDLLSQKSRDIGVNVDVIKSDLFSPPGELIETFYFVTSFGVVEHFTDLPEVLKWQLKNFQNRAVCYLH